MNERVQFVELPGIALCLLAALGVNAGTLPLWVPVVVASCLALRLLLGARSRAAPPKAVMFVVALLAMGLLFVRFRTFNGLSAGTALLALTAGLKFLETRTRRDIYVVVLVIYFLALASLLQSESFWLLACDLLIGWGTSLALLRVATAPPAPPWGRSVRYGARLALQALPLALIFWLLFPRLQSPLWHLPGDGGAATTGLSDSMSPGDITSLAQSEEVAFRVHFTSAPPAPRAQYWRGPVLHDFDGRTWRHTLIDTGTRDARAATRPLGGTDFTYTVNLEPHEHNWVYALDLPVDFTLERGRLTADYTLVQPDRVDRPIDVQLTSNSGLPPFAPLSAVERSRDLRLPPAGNPRTRELARSLRARYDDDTALVQAVLQMITREPYFYTLTPPPLGADSVDEFLFDTRRGFCGHYASAFAVLMRAARIPARVVTGYQGGTYNRFANYWIVRQSEAHAWTEVFIEGRGWMRIDPTAAINPSRVEQAVNDQASADEPLASRWQGRSRWLRDAQLRLDQLTELWREQILTFNQDSQERLMHALHIPDPDGEKLVLLLAGGLGLAFGWLAWSVRRELLPRPADPAVRAYARLCARLAAVGLPRRPHEGAADYARRIATARPDLAPPVARLCAMYNRLRYAQPPGDAAVAQFRADVRAFRPRGSRASRGSGSPASAPSSDRG